MWSGIAALFTLVSDIAQQAAAEIGGFFSQAASDLGLAVSGTYNQASDAAITAVGNISSAVNAVAAGAANGITIAFQKVDAAVSEITHLDQIMVERGRQYLLARLAANPLGVIAEGLLVVHKAGGTLSLPDPNTGSPAAVLDAAATDMRAAAADPAHAWNAIIAEAAADMRAARAGTPVPVPAPADSPAAVPGFPALTDPAGADPFAAGLLTGGDRQYVADTTSASP